MSAVADPVASGSDVVVLSMQFLFSPGRPTQSAQAGGISTSISERLVDFVRRQRASSSREDVEELAERVRQLVDMTKSASSSDAVPEIEIVANRMINRVQTAERQGQLESVDRLVDDIRELRQLTKVAARSYAPSGASSATPGDGAQLLSGIESFLRLASGDEPVLLRCSFGSPFEVAIAIVGSSGAALRLLFYGAKRLYGFDLEAQAHREELRVRLERAKLEAADLARMSSQDARRKVIDEQLADPAMRAGRWRGETGYVVDISEDPAGDR